MRFRAGQRLRRTGEFRAVREEGRRIDCGAFLFSWWQREDASTRPARVGVVASRVAVGNAVLRARAKRRLRELFRRHQELIPSGIDVVLVAKAAILRVEFCEAGNRFVQACARLPRPVAP